jgi:hypothetical protein
VRGAIFESKEGRHAVFAKVVIDTTGDADLIAKSGVACETDIDASDIHHCINTAFLLGGVDMERWLTFRREQPDAFAAFMAFGRKKLKFFEKPFVSWRNDVALFMGPRRPDTAQSMSRTSLQSICVRASSPQAMSRRIGPLRRALRMRF